MIVAGGDGHPQARIFLVGEAWGSEEERTHIPFSGASGQELNRMLHGAGIMRSECYASNVVNARPPANDIDQWITKKRKNITPDMLPMRDMMAKPIVHAGYTKLLEELDLIKPNIIVALGNKALWALTGASGILKWRGSQLHADVPGRPMLIPTIHPAAVLRDPGLRNIVVHDLKRAGRWRDHKDYDNAPQWRFATRPTFAAAKATLESLIRDAEARRDSLAADPAGLAGPGRLWLDFDLETRAGHIACAGISWSRTEAISIPFMCVESREGYWLLEQEAELVFLLWKLLTHPAVAVRGQNLLYDCQYTYRHWHFVPRVAQDTMISQHTAWCGLPKSLAYQASMYCDHYVYWKDDGKTWEKNVTEDQLWRYNQIDCVRTRECGENLLATIERLGLGEVDAFQQKFFWPVLKCMQRGIRIDKKRREQLDLELMEAIEERTAFFEQLLGHPLNPGSALQMRKLFYEDLNQRPIFTRAVKGKAGHLTLGKEALRTLEQREPLLRPLIQAIREYRSLGVFLKTFIRAPLDIDGRMRTSYNICGTKTYRFSSSKNAFGSGGNLQNIPAGDEVEEHPDDEDEAVDEDAGEVETLHAANLPNVRKMFIPDEGFIIFDKDLSKADLRIVVWEADETEMKAMLAEGRDPYVETAREYYKDPTIKKTRDDGSPHPLYKVFKSFAHGTHYLGTAKGLADRLGLTVHQAERAQRWYLGRYSKIKKWQEDFCAQLNSRRFVENKFGYRRHFFGRIDDRTYREAIAWLPQSTVALYINRIWMNLEEKYPYIWVLMQVHDSLVGQFPTHRYHEAMRDLEEASKIVLPYDDPLIIPTGTKVSRVSWGDCE